MPIPSQNSVSDNARAQIRRRPLVAASIVVATCTDWPEESCMPPKQYVDPSSEAVNPWFILASGGDPASGPVILAHPAVSGWNMYMSPRNTAHARVKASSFTQIFRQVKKGADLKIIAVHIPKKPWTTEKIQKLDIGSNRLRWCEHILPGEETQNRKQRSQNRTCNS